MTMNDNDHAPLEEPLAELERRLINEYVEAAGRTLSTLLAQHDEGSKKILEEASRYASEKLSEIEARSRYLHKLHGDVT